MSVIFSMMFKLCRLNWKASLYHSHFSLQFFSFCILHVCFCSSLFKDAFCWNVVWASRDDSHSPKARYTSIMHAQTTNLAFHCVYLYTCVCVCVVCTLFHLHVEPTMVHFLLLKIPYDPMTAGGKSRRSGNPTVLPQSNCALNLRH